MLPDVFLANTAYKQEKEESQKLAAQMVKELAPSGTKLKFAYSFKWAGQYDYESHTITLALNPCYIRKLVYTRDVMYHEIAHASLPLGEKHGPKWAAKCREFGGSADSRFYAPRIERWYDVRDLPHSALERSGFDLGTVMFKNYHREGLDIAGSRD